MFRQENIKVSTSQFRNEMTIFYANTDNAMLVSSEKQYKTPQQSMVIKKPVRNFEGSTTDFFKKLLWLKCSITKSENELTEIMSYLRVITAGFPSYPTILY